MGTLYEFSGSAHMAAEHNVLFSLAEAPLDSAPDLMADGFVSGIFGCSSSVTGGGLGYTTLPFDLSTDSSSAGRALIDNSAVFWSTQCTAEEPEVITASSAILGTGAAVCASTGGPNPIAVIIAFFKNDRPNSRVEKSAAAVYNSLHGNPDKPYSFPAVITESSSGYETAAKVFGGSSLEKAKETLDVWESILKEHV